jgi:hypothetical protein
MPIMRQRSRHASGRRPSRAPIVVHRAPSSSCASRSRSSSASVHGPRLLPGCVSRISRERTARTLRCGSARMSCMHTHTGPRRADDAQRRRRRRRRRTCMMRLSSRAVLVVERTSARLHAQLRSSRERPWEAAKSATAASSVASSVRLNMPILASVRSADCFHEALHHSAALSPMQSSPTLCSMMHGLHHSAAEALKHAFGACPPVRPRVPPAVKRTDCADCMRWSTFAVVNACVR